MGRVVIIGGGAAGLMAAISASENKGNSVTVLERQQRVGKKLSVTGNGRCNLTNTSDKAGKYHGKAPEFADYALKSYGTERTLELFHQLGLLTVEEPGGRVYPLTDSANSVVDILRFACESRGVRIVTSSEVGKVRKNGAVFRITAGEDSYEADSLIVACGGAAGAKAGGVMLGYELLQSLGHHRTALRPSLVQITTDSEYPRGLKGVRAEALLKIVSEGELRAESRGELQFTEKGISGPVSFEVSGAAAALGDLPKQAVIDLLPDYDESRILNMLRLRRQQWSGRDAGELFAGMLQGRLGTMLVKYAGIPGNMKLGQLSDGQLEKACASVKNFRLKIKGTEGFESAQVTSGGINTGEFNPKTMESRLLSGLYACGEVLDIDGDCGGYNLQWAWSSGYLAGRLGK